MICLSKKLFYVRGVDTQDFVLADTQENEIWNKIESLQLEKYNPAVSSWCLILAVKHMRYDECPILKSYQYFS